MRDRTTVLNDCIDGLVRLGLTRKQATVYVALLANRLTKPSLIADACNIERAEVYRIIRSLAKLGMVELVSENPLECNAVTPEKALASERQKLQELMEVEKRLQAPLESIMIERKPIIAKPKATLLPHRLASRKRVEMIENASNEILICSPKKKLSELLAESDAIWARVVRDVQVKVITSILQTDELIERVVNEMSASQSLFEIRHVEELFSFFLIADNREILIEPNSSYEEDLVGLWTNIPGYLSPFRDYFKKMWKESINAQYRLNLLRWAKSIAADSDHVIT